MAAERFRARQDTLRRLVQGQFGRADTRSCAVFSAALEGLGSPASPGPWVPGLAHLFPSAAARADFATTGAWEGEDELAAWRRVYLALDDEYSAQRDRIGAPKALAATAAAKNRLAGAACSARDLEAVFLVWLVDASLDLNREEDFRVSWAQQLSDRMVVSAVQNVLLLGGGGGGADLPLPLVLSLALVLVAENRSLPAASALLHHFRSLQRFRPDAGTSHGGSDSDSGSEADDARAGAALALVAAFVLLSRDLLQVRHVLAYAKEEREPFAAVGTAVLEMYLAWRLEAVDLKGLLHDVLILAAGPVPPERIASLICAGGMGLDGNHRTEAGQLAVLFQLLRGRPQEAALLLGRLAPGHRGTAALEAQRQLVAEHLRVLPRAARSAPPAANRPDGQPQSWLPHAWMCKVQLPGQVAAPAAPAAPSAMKEDSFVSGSRILGAGQPSDSEGLAFREAPSPRGAPAPVWSRPLFPGAPSSSETGFGQVNAGQGPVDLFQDMRRTGLPGPLEPVLPPLSETQPPPSLTGGAFDMPPSFLPQATTPPVFAGLRRTALQ